MNARVLALLAPCVLVGCAPKKDDKPPPPPPPGKPVSTPTTGAAPAPTPSAPLPALATDPGGATGKPVWGVTVGGPATDAARDLAVDAAGDAYVVGYFEKQCTFAGLGARTAVGGSDAFVTRIGADGKPAWVQTFGAGRDDVGNAVAVDGKGAVAVTGNFLDALSIGDPAKPLAAKAAGSDDVYVAVFEPGGGPRWLWTAGGIDSDGGNAIAASPDGGWVVGGSFMRHAELGPHGFDSLGGTDAFLVKLAPGGEVAWALQLGGTYGDTITRVAVDPSGSIYVLGEFADKANFGGETLVANGNAGVDVALAKYDASGRHLWSTHFGNQLDDHAYGMAVDPAGNVTVVGAYQKTMTLGTDTFTSTGEDDLYVVRFAGDGKFQWAKAWGSVRQDAAAAVAADAAGNVIVTGWFQQTIDVGAPAALTSKGNKDVLAIKLRPDGTTVWARGFGDKDHDQGRGVGVDAKGNPILAGLFRFTLGDVTPALESVHEENDKAPKADVFVLRLER